jgi:hypothetical protein
MSYHHHSLFISLRKYKLLFSSEESKAVSDFMDAYEGIALYMSIKKNVNERAICSQQTAVGKAAPFTFHFPEVDGKIKEEPDISSSGSKRKHQLISQVTACAMPMDSDPTGVYGL